MASRICSDIKILPYFDKYRRCGFYPFYKRSPTHYLDQLLETVHKVLDVDYPGIEEVSQDTIRKAKKMLMILSSSCPQTPNMSALYRELGTERAQGLKMLSALVVAGFLALPYLKKKYFTKQKIFEDAKTAQEKKNTEEVSENA